MTVETPEEWKKWYALDAESQQIGDVDQFDEFLDKIIETLENSPEINEDFRATDFLANVSSKFLEIDDVFSDEDQEDEMFKRCLRWFALVMSDGASSGTYIRKHIDRD